MPLRRGEVRGFDFNRMVIEFTMLNQDKVIPCAISTAAMDDLEGKRDVKPDQWSAAIKDDDTSADEIRGDVPLHLAFDQ